MIVYIIIGMAFVAAVIGYEHEQDSIAALLCCVGLPLYVQATRNTRLRPNVVFTTVMLCVGGVTAATLAVLFWAGGSTLAAASLVLATIAVACVAYTEVPTGVRVVRAALRAERR